ncbi:DUF6153 family protein [Streptomyces sp. GESEQ-35]|uniref:DUF6153 family protein n=1 Tax=Streptomyces sp. GESEQ-35 TaxID=2812657 RepID=UPI0027E346BC|nr:DUF6153 family protein [Streptomyces sp. GESEQ-35]
MARLGQLARPHSTVRFSGLLVCALLLGLLGMHGLGPVPPVAAAPGHERMAAVEDMRVVASMPGTCDHGDGGCEGHTDHADATCASASANGSPTVVPMMLPDVAAWAAPTQLRTSPSGCGPDGGRAPPSLSELQLLRI